MKKKADYQGSEPEAIYVVSSEGKFRTYIYEKQAINWLAKLQTTGKPAKLTQYAKL